MNVMNKESIFSMVKEIREEVALQLDLTNEPKDEEIKEVITKAVIEKSKKSYISISNKQQIINYVFNAMRKLDILQELMDDNSITEIMVNARDEIFVERNGKTQQVDLSFESEDRLISVIQSIVSKVNRVVNESSPIVDARLENGSRVNIVLPPVALKGPTVTIRKFPEKPLTIEKMIELGTVTHESASMLEKLVKAKYNIFVSGGTGSGKTTLLNALSNFIPQHERIITIEDSAELQLKNINNLVRLETRNANTEGKGAVSVRDLIKTSLRMRPDRIIVGEVRGPEALDMLQAMNTGHDGSISTGHANTTTDMFNRLESMVLSAAVLPVDVVRQHIASAIDIIIHLGKLRDGSRKVLEISEIAGYSSGEIRLNTLFKFEENVKKGNDNAKENAIFGYLKPTGNKLINSYKLKMAGINLY